MAFTVHLKHGFAERATLPEAVTVLLRATKADPEVTFMPYINHDDGTRLTQAELDEQDRIEQVIDYDALVADATGKEP